MNLIVQNVDDKLKKIARKVYEQQLGLDPKLHQYYNEQQKRVMYNDIIYNLEILVVALKFSDGRLFRVYAVWIYQLFCSQIKNVDRKGIRDQMILHYELLGDALSAELPENQMKKARKYLSEAIRVTISECLTPTSPRGFVTRDYQSIKADYLGFMLKNDTRGALEIIAAAAAAGVPIEEIYTNILQEVMHEVGNLWHQSIITVDKEHYCTATTQIALAQFYPVIFGSVKNGYKILSGCVGSELHEMGIRMISDLFEYHGWDSYYLGAAVPKEAILHAIKANHYDLVALSVTMPHHLPLCFELVKAIRQQNPRIKIAVGGRAFQVTDDLCKKWAVDISTKNARQLLDWAQTTFIQKGGARV